MSIAIACDALRSARRLELRYDGYVRVVEIHAVGFSRNDDPLMRVWQVRGGSAGGEPTGWKLLRVNEALGVQILDERSEAPRSGYRRNDSAMTRIACQL